MQSRTLCLARNKYNAALALRAAFATVAQPADAVPYSPPEPQAPQDEEQPSFGIRTPQRPQKPDNERLMHCKAWQAHMGLIRKMIKEPGEVHIIDGTPLNRDKVMGYTGRPVRLPKSIKGKDRKGPPPWVPRTEEEDVRQRPLLYRDMIATEITAFAAHMETTHFERIGRLAVIEDVKSVLDDFGKLGKLTYEVFGSETNGLAVPLSDIDFRVWDPSMKRRPEQMRNLMSALLTRIARTGRWTNLRYLRDRSFPIIDIQHKASGIDVQIVASHPTHPRQQDAITKLLSEIPNLRELFLVVRTFFDIRGLNEVYYGGLGSYSIFIMLAAALYRRDPTDHAKHYIVGAQLRRFFNFYKHLNWGQRGVHVSPSPFFMKWPAKMPHATMESCVASARRRGDRVRAGQWRMCQRHDLLPDLLTLQDPADPFNDLGRNCYASRHIAATLAYAGDMLRTLSASWPDGQLKSVPVDGFLWPLVSDCYERYLSGREQLERFGASVEHGRWRKSVADEPVAEEAVVDEAVVDEAVAKEAVATKTWSLDMDWVRANSEGEEDRTLLQEKFGEWDAGNDGSPQNRTLPEKPPPKSDSGDLLIRRVLVDESANATGRNLAIAARRLRKK